MAGNDGSPPSTSSEKGASSGPFSGFLPSTSNDSYRFHQLEGTGGGTNLDDVMKALRDPNTPLIGFCGSHGESLDGLLEKVRRRVHRDGLFDRILTATVTKKNYEKNIQEEIARQLGLTFNHKSINERAQELIGKIKVEQRIMIVLCDLHKKLDLGKVGIPDLSDHRGCKILLTSPMRNVLNDMHNEIIIFDYI